MQPQVTHLECHACGREDFATIDELLEHDCEDGGAAPALLADGGHGDVQTTDERVAEVRRLADQGICYQCREEVTVHDGTHVASQVRIAAIRDAVTHANRHPANSAIAESDGVINYVIEDGYYPGEYRHYVDLSGIDPELRRSASTTVISELERRNLAVNSVQFDPPRLHVMALDQMAFGYYGGDQR
ncbi:hypothetical protein D3D02_17105 [Halobellus sp. Atlit-38R]|uniref:hypothetical protein n=1 Tax=Halobellus sp. Atlit-38R TaxID=2282131 RepID=UPI000EF2597E|nr:hypothetical protein [Halobellus sp. Atlit-38R]RLM83721.1 hypothetical protein D3D02_17105 [Halobellus sp. Atlit-38R]